MVDPLVLSHQCVEGGDGEDSQASQGGFRGPAGERQQALGVRQLSTLQAGQVASHPKQIHVKPLQVLLPLLDLMGKERLLFIKQVFMDGLTASFIIFARGGEQR